MVGVSIDMKAWRATFNGYLDDIDDASSVDYVFANNAKEAKKKVADGGTEFDPYTFDNAKDNGASYTDIRVTREPDLDGYDEHATLMEFYERLVEKCNWSFTYLLGVDFEFDGDNFAKDKFEKSFIDIFANNYTVSCATCNKDIYAKDNVWVTDKSYKYGYYFCSFDCLVKGLTKNKYAIKLIQDNHNEFTAKKVTLHEFLNLY